ncbi:MAG TPA: tetratricopeptide repeat protein [Candidatus Binatia bacterium]|nr:tetratricopeptide repeat protein [Candidatus Binatia bacterium]
MKPITHLAILALLALGVSSCVTAQGEVQAGRRDLLYGDPNHAVVRFQNAAAANPDALYFSYMPEGVWTYVGRAYYQSGRLPEARQALERAVARSSDDSLARLYLGLTLAREGDRPGGLKNIESGLTGIHSWLDYLENRLPYGAGRYWDPRKEIRGEIRLQLATIGPNVNWPRLIAGSEWVGRQMEEEIERARFDERQEYRLEGEGKQP